MRRRRNVSVICPVRTERPPRVLPLVAWVEDPQDSALFTVTDVALGVGTVLPNVPLPWFRMLRATRDGRVRCQVPTPVDFPSRLTVEVEIPTPALVEALQQGVAIGARAVSPLVWHHCDAGVFLAPPGFERYEQIYPRLPRPEWPPGVFLLPWDEAKAQVFATFEADYWHNIFMRALSFTHAAALGRRPQDRMKSIFRRFGFTRNFDRR